MTPLAAMLARAAEVDVPASVQDDVRTLAGIVEALAKAPEAVAWGRCTLCGVEEDQTVESIIRHAASCPWLRARALVEGKP